jgi:hypothetical protein
MKFAKNILFFLCISFCFFSCKNKEEDSSREKLLYILENQELTKEARFSVINQISQSMLNSKETDNLILFLSDYTSKNPDDIYCAYWLLMIAYAYQLNGADPIAEKYFERILNNYEDLLVKGKSVHMLCLQNLIHISEDPNNRIIYFSRLISHFPNEVSKTELYYRLAMEYERLGEWTQVLNSYSEFLAQPDASEIQIAGISNPYGTAKNLIEFNNSSKDWTFETLDDLVTAVKRSISWYDYNTLEKYKSKVNFFAMAWRQDEEQENSRANFSMRDYGYGKRIRYSEKIDETSTPYEAYLRTWGWSVNYINVWYFYFRKINFPLDPEIHGRWEWAGIYFGEKL